MTWWQFGLQFVDTGLLYAVNGFEASKRHPSAKSIGQLVGGENESDVRKEQCKASGECEKRKYYREEEVVIGIMGEKEATDAS
jgi:hypothetical protein